jgi:hypothetical protein
MTKRYEGLDLPELDALLEAKKKQYEEAFNEGKPYSFLIDLYKEIKLIQHRIVLIRVQQPV